MTKRYPDINFHFSDNDTRLLGHHTFPYDDVVLLYLRTSCGCTVVRCIPCHYRGVVCLDVYPRVASIWSSVCDETFIWKIICVAMDMKVFENSSINNLFRYLLGRSIGMNTVLASSYQGRSRRSCTHHLCREFRPLYKVLKFKYMTTIYCFKII